MSDFKKVWRKKARVLLALAFGGKCTICGYNDCIAAFDYHHINPSEKDEQLCIYMKNGASWGKIVTEARKCTLLCCRCHRELHNGFRDLPTDCARFNEEYADAIKVKQIEYDTCPICGSVKNKLKKYCSTDCSHQDQKRFDPSKDELEVLVATTPFTKIGAMFGVSDGAVKKRCKKLGIETGSRRGFWTGKTKAVLV